MMVLRIVQTCAACPSQWEGFLGDGRAFYIRYRFGTLRMLAHATMPLSPDADVVMEEHDEGDRWKGDMTYAQLRAILANAGISAPERMDSPNTRHRSIVPAIAAMKEST
jgi:hypothetical protein